MQRFAAQLRHRELTQELYDIGDELATYLENIIEAIDDWDGELVEDCLAEFDDIVAEARTDARNAIGELIGLRAALTTGLRAGYLSARPAAEKEAEEAQLAPIGTAFLEAEFPLGDSPLSVSELSQALTGRTSAVLAYLRALVEGILQATDDAANDPSTCMYPQAINRYHDRVHCAATAWLSAVATAHPAYCRARRGHNPPVFLAERARVDAVLAKVMAKRKNGSASAAG